jgi:hypothetical protein
VLLLTNYTQFISRRTVGLGPNVDMGEGVEKSENIQQPKHDGDDHHCIQDGFNRSLHGDEAVDQPEQKSDHDQNYEYLK